MKKLCIATFSMLILMMYSSVLFSQNENMSRTDWLKIKNKDERKMAYTAMSSECQYRFWKDRFVELKQLKWSKDELKHIEEFETFLSENKNTLFPEDKKEREKSMTAMNDFAESWMKEAEEELGWSKELVYHIVADGELFTDEMLNELR